MKRNTTYETVHARWQEVMVVPPQTMGVFTPFYKKTVPFLKNHPMRVLLIVSLIASFVLYIVWGVSLVSLVSRLQQGF